MTEDQVDKTNILIAQVSNYHLLKELLIQLVSVAR